MKESCSDRLLKSKRSTREVCLESRGLFTIIVVAIAECFKL